MKKNTLFWSCVAVLLIMAGHLHAQNKVQPLLTTPDARCTQWVDSVMAELSLPEKAGQLLMAAVPAQMDKVTKK